MEVNDFPLIENDKGFDVRFQLCNLTIVLQHKISYNTKEKLRRV